MSRVELTFDGNARGAVGAAKQTVEAIGQVKRTANEQASSNIAKRVEERRSLQSLAAEYTKVAKTAKRGSEEQVAALKLEQRALRELSDTHGVYTRRLSSSTKEVERFSKGALLGSGALGHMGRTAALASGAFLGGMGLITVFKDAVAGGADLQTQMQRTDKVFGESAAAVKAWSENSVKALALARAETLDYAASIGTLLQNMGMTPAASAEMSRTLLQRAADVAAFKGVATGDVVGAFNAGLQGRTRALKQYGIVLDATAIKQEAERLGLVKNTVDLSKVTDATNQVRIAQFNLDKQIAKHGAQSAEAAKATIQLHNAERQLTAAHKGHAEALTTDQRALATYNAILGQTGKQQGWLEGHSKTLAVQERILHAEIKTLHEQLGTALLPILTKYLPVLTAWIDKNEKNGTFQRDFNSAIGAATPIVKGVVAIVKTAAKVFNDFADAVGGSKNAVELLGGLFVGYKMTKGLLGVINHVKALRVALMDLGDGAVLGVLGGVATALAVLVSSGDAPNVPSIATDEKTKKGAVGRIAKRGGFPQAVLLEATAVAGLDPNTPAGRVLANPKAIDYLYKWASDKGIIAASQVGGVGKDVVWSGDHAGLDTGFKSKLGQCVAAAGGTAINVTSGRRSPSHNAAVGGAHNSNHLTGHAADGTCLIGGRSYPLGDAPIAYGKFGLRAGRSFDWGGAPDVYHVDDGTNVGGPSTTTTTTPTTTTDTGTTNTGGFVEKPKPTKSKILTGTALLDRGLQLALATAHGTPGTADDLRYLKEARAELEKLQKTASKAEQVPIAKELANVNRQITAIDTANLKSKLREIAKAHREAVASAKAAFAAEKAAWQQHVRELQAAADHAKQVFESSWQNAADRTISAFDDITSRQLTSMGKATSQQLSKMQKDAAAAINQLQVTVAGSGFASFLFGSGAQTPTEMLLAKRAAARQASDDVQSVADARKALADAQAALAAGPTGTAGTSGVAGHDAITLASGDTVTGIGTAGTSGSTDIATLQQAVVDAQKQLDDAIYQQETDDLQAKAQLERDAADKALTDAQNAFQDQADQQQQAYQDQQDAAQQAYQDQRAIERQNISDWLAFQEAGLEAGTIQWTNFYAQLVALAGANGLAVGAAFWGAWQDANNASGAQQTSAAVAQLVASYKPETAGSWQGLVDANGVPVAAGFQGFDAHGKWTGVGFASGGWASQGRPRVDPRDTIPALLRRGEYVMSPDEVAVGRPRWSQGGGRSVGDVYLDGKKVGVHVAPHVTDAQERQIGYMSPRG